MKVSLACNCCLIELGRDYFQTYDGRLWCQEHGPIALRLEREAYDRGEREFTMPGPFLLWAREQRRKNNQKRGRPV